MSHLSTIELEEFFSATYALLEDLSDRKLLKKIPDDIGQRVVKLLEEYKPPAPAVSIDSLKDNSGPLDSRSGSLVILPSISPAELPSEEIWWTGNVEVRGLPKGGNKWQKFFAVCANTKICFFPGKKKQMKAQILLGTSSSITEGPSEDKKKPTYTIQDRSYPNVQLKFANVSEGGGWYEAHLKRSTAANLAADTAREEEQEILVYEDCDSLNQQLSRASSSQSNRNTPDHSRNTPEPRASPARSEPPALQRRYMPAPPPPPPPPPADAPSLPAPPPIESDDPAFELPDIDKLDAEQLTVLDQEPPECWGDFEFSHVYQLEWPFNLSYHDTPQLSYKGTDLLTLWRGEMVLLNERVTSDWWVMTDCKGNKGFLPSCYLSLAYQ